MDPMEPASAKASAPRVTAPVPPARRRRGAPLQVEDFALFALIGLVEPAFDRWLGGAPGGTRWAEIELGAPGAHLAALLMLGAAFTAAVCIVTRPRGDPPREAAELFGTLEGYARFPLMVLVGVMLDQGLEGLGVRSGEGLFFGVVLALSLPLAFYPRLPELSVPWRRLLMLPTLLVGAAMFSGFVGDFLGDGSLLEALPARDDPVFGFAVFMLSLILFGTAAFYFLLVVAPRKVAGAAGGVVWWGLRFLVFLGALALNLTVPF
jgi:hypothetical protein